MKKIKLLKLLSIALALCMISCNDEIVDENFGTQTLRKSGDGKYDALGCGYDITKDYFNLYGVSQIAIIDVNAIAADYPEHTLTGIITSKPNSFSSFQIVGETASQFTRNLSSKANVGYSPLENTTNAFSGTVTGTWSSSESYSSKYSVAMHQQHYALKQVTIGLSSYKLTKYLTSEFKDDLKNLTDILLIQKYGTHVLSDITLGGKVEIMFKAKTTSSNKTKAITASLNAAVKAFSFGANASYDQTLASQTYDHSITYRTIGGDASKTKQETFSTDPTKFNQINLNDWINSLAEKNYSLIDSKPGSLIPIFDLVEDPVKKNQLEATVRRYILDCELRDDHNQQIALDGSGLVETIIVKKEASGQHVSVSNTLPEDYILIGGRASISDGLALLTKSYPDMNLTTWHAESKDHIDIEHHTLTSYAIGLKLRGVSKAELAKHITIRKSTTSASSSLPSAEINLPSGYTLIGGGAKINWSGWGNLLIESAPTTNGWSAKGKDHIKVSPATIEAYAIGIKKSIANFGELEITRNSAQGYEANFSCELQEGIPKGWVLTCPGAKAAYNGFGRMLYSIEPSLINVKVASKSHKKKDSGNTYLHFIKIRKK